MIRRASTPDANVQQENKLHFVDIRQRHDEKSGDCEKRGSTNVWVG